ncbi:hypothetical protein NDU88_003592 [Pleurodeles waltl]|uniref:Uncharacterized protein n=1 Tax=Pleurodeles waltl TaxID=8319 RepID=A0AAV7NLW5_PLEWA|nr:hypothetical protein NDU88_003592 [Pleurodeles waltl]
MSERAEDALADEEGHAPLETRQTAGSGMQLDMSKSECPGDALADEGALATGDGQVRTGADGLEFGATLMQRTCI